MKTHQEILVESRRIEELGRQFSDDQRRAIAGLLRGDPAPRLLMTFPDSVIPQRFPGDGEQDEDARAQIRGRWIEVAMQEGALEYRLMQAEAAGASDGSAGPKALLLVGSDSAFDVLEEGYELAEQERLGELLAPYAERAEADELVDSIDPAVVEEIETIIGAGEFSAAGRLGTRADIVEFLEGRIEPSAFIKAAISRGYYRDGESHTVVERRGERIVMERP